MTLMAFLGAPRVVYRLSRARLRAGGQEVQSALLVGAGEGADSFLRALASERPSQLRVAGLLSLGGNQTGRRIQGRPILGGLSELRRVLERLNASDRLPDVLVVTEPGLAGSRMGYILEEAQRQGIPVRQAPRPTELREAGTPNSSP